MGAFDTIGNAAKDMGRAALDEIKGFERSTVDQFRGAVQGAKTSAETVVQAGTTMTHGVADAAHDGAEALHRHDVFGGIARVHQDLAGGAGTAISQAWDGAGKSAGQVAGGLHKSAADLGTATGHAYDKLSGAATHVATSVAGKHAGALVGSVTHGAGAAGRALADGSLSAVTALATDVGGMVHGTGNLAIGIGRAGTDADYRDKMVAKFKQGALAIGDVELAAMRDPAGAKAKLEHAVHGKVEQFDQEGLKAMREGKLPEFVGGGIGHATAILATAVAPEGRVADAAIGAGRLADGAIDATRVARAADEVGDAEATGAAAEGGVKADAAGAQTARPMPGSGGAGAEPPKPPAKATGPGPSDPGEGPNPAGKPAPLAHVEHERVAQTMRDVLSSKVRLGDNVSVAEADHAVASLTQGKSAGEMSELMNAHRGDHLVVEKEPDGKVSSYFSRGPAPRRFVSIEARAAQVQSQFQSGIRVGDGVSVADARRVVRRLTQGKSPSEVNQFMTAHQGESLVVEKAADGTLTSSFAKLPLPQRYKPLKTAEAAEANVERIKLAARMARFPQGD